MTTNGEPAVHLEAVIGNDKSFWLYDSKTGFDLTHPPKPDSPAISPRVTIETKTSPITVDPAKSALVIVDMQNYFLSEALGRAKGAGHKALEHLVKYAIPACRKASIRIIWLNWGLSQQEIDDMAPAVIRAFGFTAKSENGTFPVDKYGNPTFTGGDKIFEDGKDGRKYKGLGSDMGKVTDPKTGKDIDAGRMLMRDQWVSFGHLIYMISTSDISGLHADCQLE
jgi:hypothetical protein